MEALQTANASLLRPASGAAQVQPRTERAVVLGVMLGLMLGIGLAFVRDALDTRVRSSNEIADRLGTTLLGRIAVPPRKLRRKHRLVMIAMPHSAQAEAFRMLRANLEFVNLDRGARSILVTSALEREGKSTTVANLAVALARAGQRVALVDLDLRRPAIARFFGIPSSHPGITNIITGSSRLDHALMEVSRSPIAQPEAARVGGNGLGSTGRGGVLKVLTSGPVPRDPGEVVKDERLTDSAPRARAVVRFRPHRYASAALRRRRDGPQRQHRRVDHRRPSEHAEARCPRRARPVARDLPHGQARCRRHRRRGGGGLRLRGLRVPQLGQGGRLGHGSSGHIVDERRGDDAVSPGDRARLVRPVLDSSASENGAGRAALEVEQRASTTAVLGRRRDRGRPVRRSLLLADLGALVVAFAVLQLLFPSQAENDRLALDSEVLLFVASLPLVGRPGSSDRTVQP